MVIEWFTLSTQSVTTILLVFWCNTREIREKNPKTTNGLNHKKRQCLYAPKCCAWSDWYTSESGWICFVDACFRYWIRAMYHMEPHHQGLRLDCWWRVRARRDRQATATLPLSLSPAHSQALHLHYVSNSRLLSANDLKVTMVIHYQERIRIATMNNATQALPLAMTGRTFSSSYVSNMSVFLSSISCLHIDRNMCFPTKGRYINW